MNHDFNAIRQSEYPAECYCVENTLSEVNFQDNELHDIQSKESAGQCVRVISDGRIGVARGGHGISLDELLPMAASIGRFGRPALFEFPSGDGSILTDTCTTERLNTMDIDTMVSFGSSIISDLNRGIPGWKIQVMLQREDAVSRLVNSKGIDWTFKQQEFGFHIVATHAREGDIIEIHEARASYPDHVQYASLIESLIHNTTQCLVVRDVPGGEYPVLLHPCALGSFLDAIEQGVNARNVFDGVSPLKDRIGETILDERISLWDNPVNNEMPGYAPRSDEGVVSFRKPIIENGVLRQYLSNLEYAARLGLTDGSNGFRDGQSSSGLPSAETRISSTNLVMAPGTTPWGELLGGMDRGILLLQSWDCWSGNLLNGDISGSIHLGFWVENGKIAGRVKDMRVSGNIYDLLGKQLVDLSAERPESIAATLKAPYVLLRDVTVI